MKRLIIAAFLLLLVLLTVIFGSKTIISISDRSNVLVEECLEAAQSGDWNLAQSRSGELLTYWEDRRIVALAFANHGDIDSINERIAVLSAIADRKNLSEFEETAAEIVHLLKMLRHSQLITAESFI